MCGTGALCLSTKFITDIKRIYIVLYSVILEPFSSRNVIRAINSKGMGWAGNMARMGGKRNVYVVVVGKAEGKETTWKI